MSRWFRMYDDVLNDPKAQKLSDAAFRGWVNLLCLASKHDGMLEQPLENVAFSLRKSLPKTRELFQLLQSVGLLDRTENGWKPHNWDRLQFKSDVSTERVKRFRKRHETVSETPPDTEQIQSRTDKKEEAAPTGAVIVSCETPPASKSLVVVQSLPDWLPLDAWSGYLEMRRKKRMVNTDRAIGMLLKRLDELRLKGHDPTDILDTATVGNWKSIYEPQSDKNHGHSRQRPPSANDKNLAGAALAIASYGQDDDERREAEADSDAGGTVLPLLDARLHPRSGGGTV